MRNVQSMNLSRSFVILLLLSLNDIHSQTLYFDFGGNYGRFYDLQKEDGHFRKDYSPGTGYNFDLRVSDIKIDSIFTFQFALGFEKYESDFFATDGGMGGACSEEGSLQKQIIDFEIYPLNVRFCQNFIFSTGLEINFKVHQRLVGTNSQWLMGQPSKPDTDLNTIEGFVNRINLGLNACIGYEFIFGNIKIKPNYKYFLGISQEFNHIQSNAKSQRHNLQIGIGYSLK